MTDWDNAACIGQPPELFFPETVGGAMTGVWDRAKAICAGCPIQTACLEWQLAHEGSLEAPSRHGVYGGLDPGERARLAHARRERARYRAHRRKTQPVQTCRDCGQDRPHHAHGLCEACYRRARRVAS